MGFFTALIESMRSPGTTILGQPPDNLIARSPASLDFLRPRTHALALEPRVLFDGAAATAATDHSHPGDAGKATEAPATVEPSTPAAAPRTEAAVPASVSAVPGAPPSTPSQPAHNLLVIDSRVEQEAMLAAQAAPGVTVLVVHSNEDGVAAISAALAALGPVDSIQILSHGASGQFTLGDRTITSNNVDDLASQLQAWHAELTPGADIQLYGCSVGAGPAGQTLVNELARLTGADVGASSDATGNAAAGGNWTLETRSGDVDKSLVLNAATLQSFQGLLADASPTVALSSGGGDVLLGSDFTFTATFTNPSTQVGFAPYIDLYIPTTGRDGAGAALDDGITFKSATFQGVQIVSFDIVFDANGQAVHPLAKGPDGQPLVINAASYGLRPGDHLVVLELPNASVTSGQPAINIAVTMTLSRLADTSLTDTAPALTVKARGGFQFGNTSADDPSVDPTLVETATHDFVVHPTMVELTTTANVPDGQTATGPNYPRSFTITASTATDQRLTDVTVEQDLPNSVMVTGIVTQGAVTSITLQDGSVITDPGTIGTTLAAGAYLSHFEVTYATLSGSQNTTVNFYVPNVDANGQQILDPTTGAPRTITIAGPDATAQWTPLDPRDVPLNPGALLSGTGDAVSFQALSMVVYKPAPADTIDVGSAGPSPGDTLTYSLDVNISDYFAFGRNVVNQGVLTISDVATDGQSLVAGSGTLVVHIAGQTLTMAITPTVVVNADGTTTMTLDLAQTLRDNGQALAALVGDLAFDNTIQGATTATITYQMTVGQFFGTPSATSAINEGDTIGNNAVITGTVLVDRVTTGGTVTDSDSTSVTIPSSTVDIQILSVDATDVSQNPSVELHPGDVVTFQISYDLVTGDYQDFNLSAYLPLPLFDVNGITWTEFTGTGDPGVNQWSYGPGHTQADTVDSLAGVVNGNYLVFDFGDHSSLSQSGARVELRFTMVVGDQPFGDQRKVTVLAQSSQVTTLDLTPIVSQDAVVVDSIAEPVLTIAHGVVSSSAPDAVITGTTGSWAPPGDTGTPFAVPLTDVTDVDGNVSAIDGGDQLRMATAIENSGGGGAFDVTTRVDLPSGLSFVGGSLASTLHIYRGDGSSMTANVDYRVDGNVVTFLDPVQGQASLPAGRTGTDADNNGTNLIVLLYDVRVDDAIAASSTLQSTGVLTHYAAVKGGDDFTPVDVTDTAGEQIAAPAIKIVFADGSLTDNDSSSPSTTGANLVVGETMLYDIVVTLPEGTTSNLRVDDLIPAGMALDPSFGDGGYEIIKTAAGSGALGADFLGTVTGMTLSGSSGQDGADVRLSFTASTNNADNLTGNNSFVIRVRLVASNTQDNQAGRMLNNDVQLVYGDPDGDKAGGTAVDRTVNRTGGEPSVALQEPTLTITQSAVATGSPLGVDEGSSVTYTIVIRNDSGIDAYDIGFIDNFPTGLLTGLQLTGVAYGGSVTTNGGPTVDFVLGADGVLRTASGANIDIANGGSITLTVTGTVTSTAVNFQSINNQSSVQWTSINDAAPVTAAGGERTGVDGLLNSGVLNDYQVEASTQVKVLSGVQLSRIGGMPDTPSADNGTTTDGAVEQVAVGEIVRYRVTTGVGQGTTDSYRVQVTLDAGLSFQADDTIRIAIVSNGGVTSSYLDLAVGTLAVNGNRASDIAQPIPVDLSNGPTATMNLSHVIVSTVGGRTVVTFDLGTVTNNDADADPEDLEGIVIEFNARVDNISGNTAGKALAVTAGMLLPDNSVIASHTVSESVIEPSFTGLVKQVDSFTPNASGTTSTANMAVSFTQNGTGPAYDVTLDDPIFAGASYTLTSVTIVRADGTSTVVAPADFGANGITDTSDANGIHLSVARVDVGSKVVVTYGVTVGVDTAYASTEAQLKWSSLPESFRSWGNTSIGADTTVGPDGAIDGERDGSGTAPNTYVLNEGAGLGLIHGNLWDDTLSATTSLTPDGTALAGQRVTLRWAGADGALDTGDDVLFATLTDSAGFFHFSALAAGSYRVEAPTPIDLAQPTGEIRVRLDTDANTLGQVVSSVGEGATQRGDFAYVQVNDAPVSTVPGAQSINEDTLLNIPAITVADVDLNQGPTPGVLDVTLTVAHGVLNITATPPAGLSVVRQGNTTIVLSGTAADINAVLATLTYQGNLNFNGNDVLTVTTRDHGSYGDWDGNGTPGQATDERQDVDTVAITVIPVNDAPQGVDDVVTAREAGGTNNGTPGFDPSGNVLANDTDVDIATNGDVLHLVSVTGSAVATSVTDTTSEFAITGLYGTLHVRANGAARYEVDNANALVQALRQSGDTLEDDFSYVLADIAGAQSAANIKITIQGANDTPVAMDDTGQALEAGGTNNGTPGQDAVGNVLTGDANGGVADTDVDRFGETLSVTGVRNVPRSQAGDVTPVTPGTATVIASSNGYGTLTLNADGSYSYQANNANAAVNSLAAGATLQDVFSYRVTDAGGLSSLANLTITITGANDAPVAVDDAGTAVEAGGLNNATPGQNATGNVITQSDRDPDTGDQALLNLSGVRTGTEAAGGTAGTVGVALAGQYGTLTLNADGSYTYVVDDNNAAVQALRLAGNTLQDFFTYTVSDRAANDPSALFDTAQLTITIQGANDTPVAHNDTGSAIEAGGINNGTAGTPATGNVLTGDDHGGVADTDVDRNGETLAVQGYGQGAGSATAGAPLPGQYGSLVIGPDGSYTYTADEANPSVQALRTDADTLTEVFTYTMHDAAGATSTATLTVTIHGRNDTPSAQPDTGSAVEAGGLNNGTAGSPVSGNVLANDIDVDDPANNETRTVQAFDQAGSGGTLGSAFTAQYGTLTLNADGSYAYVVDDSNAAVQALRVDANTLTEVFNYTMVDASGAASTSTLTITVHGRNDTPVAANDTGNAIEAGGVNNGIAGSPATGNVLTNDSDVDSAANGETHAVQAFDQGGTAGTLGSAFVAQYGTLTLGTDGTYSYVVDESNPNVQRLRTDSDTLTEVFTYTMRDTAGATSTATLTIVIHGRDDAPSAQPDTGDAVEAGGVANGTAGNPATGNVLTNDTDVDSPVNGEILAVQGYSLGTSTATAGSALAGQFGSLTIAAGGSFTYTVDDNNAAVQALRLSGNTLTEVFNYTVVDAAGGTSSSTLTITLHGANDNPVAVNDAGTAIEAGGVNNGTAGSNATGNVLTNDSDVDQNGETRSVSAFDLVAGAAGTPGTRFTAQYGWLTLNADGSYVYEVDNANTAVQGLRPGQTLTEVFGYTVVDALGATAAAQLTITLQGQDDTPTAVDDTATAMEAGGTANGTPGINPSGNVLANDTDVDSADPRRLDGIRIGAEADAAAFTTVGALQPVTLAGRFGTLTVRADGSYDYAVDNSAVLVERMRGGNQDSLTDVFSYRAVDLAGQSDVAQLVVTIHGAWDAPVAVDDANFAAAGTIRNPSLGVDAVGNVLPNDTDVDVPDGKTVTGIGVGAEAGSPALTPVGASMQIDGLYGTLTIHADGSYTYAVDVLNLDVQGLQPGQKLNEVFTYAVTDNGGLSDRAQLSIEVRGINNPPFSVPDEGAAVEAGGLDNGTAGVNPRGNVLSNDIDLDGDPLTITGIRTGPVAGTGTDGAVGQVLRGQYGSLVILANGDWSYVVDNNLPAVQALRVSGQTLEERFTYTVADPLGDTDTGLLRIVIDGRNDTPVARDDSGEALEAGGVANATPGRDSVGNVLANDSDVDGTAYGETARVVSYASATGAEGLAGSRIAGLYGSLAIDADGSWHYAVDNDNPAVQALRTNGETVTESFSYVMRDEAGATSRANLVIVVKGADDNPVARDDSNVASDQVVAPQASGTVLPNDSDADGGDTLHVTAIRTGAESASGSTGQVGQPLAGRYGTLVIHADGTYTYSIDMSNPDVLAAAGVGQVLQDVFTYTVSDRAGATDLAQLTLSLDISAPRIDNGSNWFPPMGPDEPSSTAELGFVPVIFVQPVVRANSLLDRLQDTSSDGTRIGLVVDRSLFDLPTSLGAELIDQVPGQFVHRMVRESDLAAQLDLARLLGRHGRVSLSADGLLPDPSLFSYTDVGLTRGETQRPGLDPAAADTRRTADGERRTARSFSDQIKLAARQSPRLPH